MQTVQNNIRNRSQSCNPQQNAIALQNLSKSFDLKDPNQINQQKIHYQSLQDTSLPLQMLNLNNHNNSLYPISKIKKQQYDNQKLIYDKFLQDNSLDHQQLQLHKLKLSIQQSLPVYSQQYSTENNQNNQKDLSQIHNSQNIQHQIDEMQKIQKYQDHNKVYMKKNNFYQIQNSSLKTTTDQSGGQGFSELKTIQEGESEVETIKSSVDYGSKHLSFKQDIQQAQQSKIKEQIMNNPPKNSPKYHPYSELTSPNRSNSRKQNKKHIQYFQSQKYSQNIKDQQDNNDKSTQSDDFEFLKVNLSLLPKINANLNSRSYRSNQKEFFDCQFESQGGFMGSLTKSLVPNLQKKQYNKQNNRYISPSCDKDMEYKKSLEFQEFYFFKDDNDKLNKQDNNIHDSHKSKNKGNLSNILIELNN